MRDEGSERVPVAHIQQILSFYYMSCIRYLTSWHFQFRDGQKETGVLRSKHQVKLSKNNVISLHITHLVSIWYTWSCLPSWSLFFGFWDPTLSFLLPPHWIVLFLVSFCWLLLSNLTCNWLLECPKASHVFSIRFTPLVTSSRLMALNMFYLSADDVQTYIASPDLLYARVAMYKTAYLTHWMET